MLISSVFFVSMKVVATTMDTEDDDDDDDDDGDGDGDDVFLLKKQHWWCCLPILYTIWWMIW